MQLEKIDIGRTPPADVFGQNLEKSWTRLIDQLMEILNGGAKFSDNFNCQLVTVTTDAIPDTEGAVSHTLKRVPTGYLVYGRDKSGVIYDGSTAWTTTAIYLRSNVASVTANIIIF